MCVVIPCSLVSLKFQQYSVNVDTTSKLKSVTQERDVEEFVSTAILAVTEFTTGSSFASRPRKDIYV